MSWVAVAVGVGSLAAGIYGSNKASDAMESSSGQANALSERIYGQQRADQMPYMQSGYQALNAYNRLMGLAPVDTKVTSQSTGPGGLRPTQVMAGKKMVYVDNEGNGFIFAEKGENKGQQYPAGYYAQYDMRKTNPPAAPGAPGAGAAQGEDRYGGFYASPGYQFRLDEGSRAYDRSAAARGMLLSGAQVKAQTRYGQGMASEEFGNYANRLAAIAGVGQTATNNAGNAAANYGVNAGNAMMNSGMARASGYMGTANTIGSLANGVMSAIPYMGQPRQTNQLPAFNRSPLETNLWG